MELFQETQVLVKSVSFSARFFFQLSLKVKESFSKVLNPDANHLRVREVVVKTVQGNHKISEPVNENLRSRSLFKKPVLPCRHSRHTLHMELEYLVELRPHQH